MDAVALRVILLAAQCQGGGVTEDEAGAQADSLIGAQEQGHARGWRKGGVGSMGAGVQADTVTGARNQGQA